MYSIDISYLVREFYAIEAVISLLLMEGGNNFVPYMHSHERWKRDFFVFREEFTRSFADAIYDYTVLVVAGELRHAKRRATHYLRDFHTSVSTRNEVYSDCSEYLDKDILMAGVKLFDEKRVRWAANFGGDPWMKIAKAGLYKGMWSDSVFIDHCLDLSHHNGVYFDKGAGIFVIHDSSEYEDFLEYKSVCYPNCLLRARFGERFYELLVRAHNLNIIAVRPEYYGQLRAPVNAEALLLRYKPITWGPHRLKYSDDQIVGQSYYNCARRRSQRESTQVFELPKAA